MILSNKISEVSLLFLNNPLLHKGKIQIIPILERVHTRVHEYQ